MGSVSSEMKTNSCNIIAFQKEHIESAIPLFTSPNVRKNLGDPISTERSIRQENNN